MTSDLTAAQQRAQDAERLADVTHVLHGPHGTGAVQRVLYAVYLLALLAFTYGFTVARALFITTDSGWIHDRLLGPGAAVVAVALAGALTVLVHGIGRRRGPVVPPLPWVDHVVAGPLDRATTLREWWLVSATLLVAGATVTAGVLGGGLWASGTTGPTSFLIALLVGPALGVVVAAAWLAGQVRAGTPGPDRMPAAGLRLGRGGRALGPSAALRRLGLPELRAQSIRSTRLGGAVLAGDLRAARLEAATPVHRGRGLRLRSHGRLGTVVARDLIGLRRQPGLLLSGALLAAPGAAGVAWSLSDPQVPVAIGVVAVAALYLGVGVWAEGLRLLGDTLGTPRLSGLGLATEAAAHTVLPAAFLLVLALPLGVAVSMSVPASSIGLPEVVAWVVGVSALALGAQWVAAFRGRPPFLAFLPDVGPMVMTLWFARSLVLCALVGGLLTARAAAAGVLGATGLSLVTAVALCWLWGRRTLRAAADEHRV
jgi:hypothetical protein